MFLENIGKKEEHNILSKVLCIDSNVTLSAIQ